MFKISAALLSLVLLSSCSGLNLAKVEKIDPQENTIRIGLKIAAIADTHLTTEKLENDYFLRSRLADLIANEAIRTTAQEVLALENLKYLLEDMKELDPDIILYLGDGMNSGCTDEVEDFFAQLERSRAELDKPIFFVIGNHDYLAAGNQPETDFRLKTCGQGNGMYSKAELIAKVDRFNAHSFTDFNRDGIMTDFKDNIAVDAVGRPWETQRDQACNSEDPENQHNDPDFSCFYTGIIAYQKNGITGQIVLTDSSDYRDIKVQPDIALTKLYGVRGSMSWEEGGQLDWINENLSDSNDVRIIASHYNIDSLGYAPEYTFDRPGDLLLPEADRNLWLSAHTHTERPVQAVYQFKEYFIFNTKTAYEINVGSTTDFSPHFVFIESAENGTVARSYPSAEAYEELGCSALIEGITLNAEYKPVLGAADTGVQLGLTGAYRQWNYVTADVRQNVRKFLESLPVSDREKYLQCLLYTAAVAEKALKTVQE